MGIAAIITIAGLLVSGERSRRIIALGVVLTVAAVAIACAFAPRYALTAAPVLVGGGIAWSLTDFRSGYIRNALTVPLAVVLAIIGILSNGWLLTLLGIIACGGVLSMFRLMQDGSVGGGDVLAATCVGAALGAPAGPLGLAIGLTIALLLAVITCGPTMIRRYRVRIRMGPYIAAGALVGLILPSVHLAAR